MKRSLFLLSESNEMIGKNNAIFDLTFTFVEGMSKTLPKIS